MGQEIRNGRRPVLAGVGYLGTRANRGAGAQEAKMPRSRAAWTCLWGPHLAPGRRVGWIVRTAEGRDGLRTGRPRFAFG